MIGDTNDMLGRLRLTLPKGWFADDAPVLTAVLTGLAEAWSGIYALLAYVISLTRIATASGIFLDMAAQDYLGGALPRRAGEADGAYSARLRANLILPRATRPGLVEVLTTLTGRAPVVFEPLNPVDTGGYNVNLGYGVAGGYGSFALPYQFFVTAYRPAQTPVNGAGGYDDGPGGYAVAPLYYADAASFAGNVSDGEIYGAIAAALPACAVAWTQLSN